MSCEEIKMEKHRPESNLRNMNDYELVQYTDSKPAATPLEVELAERLQALLK